MALSMQEPPADGQELQAARRKPSVEGREPPSCDHCGSDRVHWVKCKLICGNCRQIVKSCADL